MGLGSAIVADGVETLWRSVSVLTVVLGLYQGVVLAIVVMLNFCQDGSQNGMHWDKIQASEGDHQHAYMCIWNRGGDMRWDLHTFLLKMPPGQQNFSGRPGVQSDGQQGSSSPLLPQDCPWTALSWKVACRSQRARSDA